MIEYFVYSELLCVLREVVVAYLQMLPIHILTYLLHGAESFLRS